jgi:hypothetical protein
MKTLAAIILTTYVCTLLSSCGDSKREQLNVERQQERKERREAAKVRAAEGLYVESTKAISDAEEISVVVVPDKAGYTNSDRRCLVYRHKTYKTSNMQCDERISIDTPSYDQ